MPNRESVMRLVLCRERRDGYRAAYEGEPFNDYASPNWKAGYLEYHNQVMASDGFTVLGERQQPGK